MNNLHKGLLAAAGIAAVSLVLLKRHFNGGVCKLRRNLRGRVAIITGGNAGIGKETVLELARLGCTVVMGSRDVDKSTKVVQQIRRLTKNENVEYYELDLSSKPSIIKFVDNVKAKYNRVDFLINNAAVLGLPTQIFNTERQEMQMAVNHLGHFYLTYLLWDILKKSDDLRIINVSALAHKMKVMGEQVSLDFYSMDGTLPVSNRHHGMYHSWYAYSASKLANILFTKELARRLANVKPGARVVSLHPGIVRTQIGRYMVTGWLKVLKVLIYPIFYLTTKSSNQGAQTTLYCVLEEPNKLINGGYYADCKLDQNVNPFVLIQSNQRKLWDKSEEMMGITFQAK